jgi:MSHA biogenesis protein MshM
MYEAHYGLSQLPFTLTPNTSLFHGLIPHYEAIQTVLAAIKMGEGVMKVTGEVGTGKTLVCRMLINQLPADIELIYLPNPVMDGHELRQAMAKELWLDTSGDGYALLDRIHEKLIDLQAEGKSIVVLIDEAQALSDETLETLRLFGNLETDYKKLLQIVLFGQPELNDRLMQHNLRQFRQRITFSADLRALSLSETVAYIDFRIEQSGGRKSLFPLSYKKAVWIASGGIPRVVNKICHKALLLGFTHHRSALIRDDIYHAIVDTSDTLKPKYRFPLLWGWS